jgi:hypothetical protein
VVIVGSLLVVATLAPGGGPRTAVDAHPPNNSLDAADGSPRNAVHVDAAGRVGVGTTTPGEALDVAGRTRSGRVTTGPWPANTAYVFWGTNALTQSAAENYALLQGASGTEQGRTFLNSPVDLRLRIRNIDRLTVAGDGNVGIGTSSPAQRLDVAGAARVHASAATHLLFTGAGDDAFIDLVKRTSATPSARIMLDGYTDQAAHQGEIVFLTKHAAVPTLTEWMRIKTSGDVGIGTADPGDRLHVHNGNVRLSRGGSWPLILEQSSASVFTIQNGGAVRFVLEPDGLAAIARLRPLADGEHDFGHVCLYPRFPPGAEVSQGWYLSRCGSAKEYVPTTDAGAGLPEAGDLVRLVAGQANPHGDERAPFVVARTERACDDAVLGLIADPVRGGADGHKAGDDYRPLVISGYFPARVTVENGPIRRGDPIMSSARPGHGTKAADGCRTVGYALEDIDRDGTIRVFAHLGEHAAAAVRALRDRLDALARDTDAMRAELGVLRAEVRALRRALTTAGHGLAAPDPHAIR